MNFPNTHYLKRRPARRQADVIFAFELQRDLGAREHRARPRRARGGANREARREDRDRSARASSYLRVELPELLSAITAPISRSRATRRRACPRSRRRAQALCRELRSRGAARSRRAAAQGARAAQRRQRSRARCATAGTRRRSARRGSAPRSGTRCASHDWALVSEPLFPWLHEIWEIEQHYQYIGGSGGAGMGYGAPAGDRRRARHREARRLVVNMQKDGDLMYGRARSGPPRITASRCSR